MWLTCCGVWCVFPSDPSGPAGAALRSAGRCWTLRLGAVLLSGAHVEAAKQQVRHPHEGRLLLGEGARRGCDPLNQTDVFFFCGCNLFVSLTGSWLLRGRPQQQRL